ncbi:MAG TPA: TIGR03013 family XrtA/PEP-CTERM system glycosyltransferase [Candidatus Acidoferrum sp.]|nr:TIGR03013 family XrtA/PEP-CTERM system glycosyltransferase [Candidatus Acidoferrum sp.]
MIRLLNAYFPRRTFFLGISEGLLVALAFIVAAIARLGATDASVMLSYEQGFLKVLVVAGAFVVCMYYFDLYDSAILSNRREVLSRLVQVLGTACLVLAILYYVYPPLELGRGIFLIGIAFVAVLLFLWRRLFLVINSASRFADRVLILGDGLLAEPLSKEISQRPELALNVIGHISEQNDGGGEDWSLEDDDRVAELPCYVRSHRIDRIIVAMSDRKGRLPVEQLLAVKSRGVLVQDATEVYEAITGKVPLESLRLGWLLFSPSFSDFRFVLIYKRLASVLVSLIGLLLCLFLLPFIALAIKLSSPGPILYRQKRVGREGIVFNCYKFRTMRADAEADTGATWAADDDPRITKVGSFLRTSRLDEIPQLWNVLIGDMSLVGPRPERPEFVEWLSREILHYNVRHTIRPGITGWAQVRYKYGSSIEDSKEKLRYDLFYVKNISPGFDLLIVFYTIKIILLGRGAK